MQSDVAALLALLLAHVLADFPLQSARVLAGKRRLEVAAYAAHLAVHLAMALACLLAFTAVPLLRAETGLVLLLLVTGHGALDLARSVLLRRSPRLDGWWLFLVDQGLHVALVLGTATLLPEVTLDAKALLALWEAQRVRVLSEALVVAVFVFPSGYLIRYLLGPLSDRLGAVDGDAPADPGLANAGLYLGWIERALLLFAFAEASITAVGLIVGAKSIVRFPEFRTRAFAEYFLLGTLLSVLTAAAGAAVLSAVRSLMA